jgi:mycothiol S-conjugate amidase
MPDPASDLATSPVAHPPAPLVEPEQAQPGPAGVFRLLSVHAHPDDEASKGSGTVARYSDAGVYAVLVTCTGGEEGDVLNPALDRPEVREHLPEVRREELASSAGIIGYAEVVMLGYRDSGMPDTEANARPEAFANASLDEAVERLVRVIRAVRPHVMLTYDEDQRGYPHPDHLRVHDISVPAFDKAADSAVAPRTGDPWQPLKLYYSSWSRARIEAYHAEFQRLGLKSPYDDRWFSRPSQDHRVTTRIDTSSTQARHDASLVAHATQVDPTSPFWFGLPEDVRHAAYPWEEFVLAKSLVPVAPDETDLFAGIDLLEHP